MLQQKGTILKIFKILVQQFHLPIFRLVFLYVSYIFYIFFFDKFESLLISAYSLKEVLNDIGFKLESSSTSLPTKLDIPTRLDIPTLQATYNWLVFSKSSESVLSNLGLTSFSSKSRSPELKVLENLVLVPCPLYVQNITENPPLAY